MIWVNNLFKVIIASVYSVACFHISETNGSNDKSEGREELGLISHYKVLALPENQCRITWMWT